MVTTSFETQNKKVPGVYINFKSKNLNSVSTFKRGVVLMPLVLDFGPQKTFIEINSVFDIEKKLGFNNESTLPIIEALKKAATVIVYRVNNGAASSFSVNDTLDIKSKYTGSLSNALSVSIKADINTEKYRITTFLSNTKIFEDVVDKETEFYDNDLIVLKGKITNTNGVFLTGGSSLSAVNQDYLEFLEQAYTSDFNTLCILVDDEILKSSVLSFVKRMREEEGKKINAVIPETANVDYEGILSVKNGVILRDGTVIPKNIATAFVSGATASALSNFSNTYLQYDGAIEVDDVFSNTQIESIINDGHIVFSKQNNKVVIVKDINTFTSFTPEKNLSFSKNRLMRVMDTISSDVKNIFQTSYIGKVSNNTDGRALFKGDVIQYIKSLENIGSITDFDADNDIKVTVGNDLESIVLDLQIKPIDSIEKLYFTIFVN